MKRIQHTLLALCALAVSTLHAAPDADALEAVLEPYFAIQTALADDDVDAAREPAGEIAELARAHEDLTAVAEAAKALREAEQLETARAHFHTLSQSLIPLVEQAGATEAVYVVFCPMAFGYDGGTWMQAGEEISNPYEGSRMLRCGVIQKTIAGE
ncbi:MAG: DUF3347 domain-containing protein [Opitutales bacterium]